ncbi:hypothetical protein FUSO6_04870 [Fusobacterium necrophorum DAB]|uniref:lipoprotein n=1 Tax=Fusobacterium necrophorum TaxID=859 RepID=UPI000460ECDE|nr:lipoprotein [Fusobacterium necrophorum]KDE70315.1 hypothetical protein FUSO6_04870 [Fusobacterium necrophorum DAB]KDE73880.1 hypothetical protein FUSO7_05640 [Fusobacterium necrophorum BFTR-2]MCF0162244.1 lipoprotein [Fusobacterium necrophorum]
MKKIYLLVATFAFLLTACSQVQTTTSQHQEALQLMEKKRKFYQKLEEEKMRQEAQLAKQKELEEIRLRKEQDPKEIERKRLEEERKKEQELLKNMTPEERLYHRIEKAHGKIEQMLEQAQKARQEEIDNEAEKKELETKFNAIIGD